MKTNSLYSTFLHTKKSFYTAGGYPTDHGFDTQGFAFRFLANDLIAYTCPDTTYLHRTNFYKSYYLREVQQGNFSSNWFKIIEEYLFLFNDKTKSWLLNYDTHNPYDRLSIASLSSNELIENYKELIAKNAKEYYSNILANKNDLNEFESYWLGSELLKKEKYEEAAINFRRSIKLGLKSIILYEKLLQTLAKIDNKNAREEMAIIKSFLKKQKKSKYYYLFWKIKTRLAAHLAKVKKNIASTLDKQKKFSNFFYSLPRIVLKIKMAFRIKLIENCVSYSSESIDIIIPTTEKDYILLKSVLDSLKNVCQSINKIFLVSNNNQKIVDFCKRNNCVFVDENNILGYGKNQINYKINNMDRSGWLFQQLLKLSGDKIAEKENFLVMDSDTILINKHNFIRKGKFIFRQNPNEWHKPYFDAYKYIFRENAPAKISAVCHMMIFNKNKLKEMREEIEKKHKQSWDKVIISTKDMDNAGKSCFSEYETYFNWLKKRYPSIVKTIPFYNKRLSRHEFTDDKIITKKYRDNFNSLSFHSYQK